MKRFVMLVLVGGCSTSAPKPPAAPAPIANEAKAPPPKAGESKQIARTASGGVVELAGDRGAALEQANDQMAQHCGSNNYQITMEGEEAVGSDAIAGQPVRIETAWRVHYVCSGAP